MKDNFSVEIQTNLLPAFTMYPIKSKGMFPLYLQFFYKFYQARILENEVIVLEIKDEFPGIKALQHHINVIKQLSDKQVVFYLRNISFYRKNVFFQQKIPFITQNGQMFLPFVGLTLQQMNHKTEIKRQLFSQSAQVTFLLFLYHEDLSLSNHELSAMLHLTPMTASRALTELYDVGLLHFEQSGKTNRLKKYSRNPRTEFYQIGYPYLRNPVWKRVFTNVAPKNSISAGLEALSRLSLLNPPDRPIKAIEKKRIDEIQKNIIPDQEVDLYENVFEVELWHYDPMLVNQQDIVDTLSLALSLKGIHDERVESAICSILKKEKWYTD